MTNASPQANTKWQRILGLILSGLASAMRVFSGFMKILQDEFLVESMEALHLLPLMVFIGFLEIVLVVLHWIPRTMHLGFYLICFFMGGIITAELIAAEAAALPIPGLPLAIIFVLGTYFRKKALFTMPAKAD